MPITVDNLRTSVFSCGDNFELFVNTLKGLEKALTDREGVNI